jgi:hypothetical protein
MGDYSLMPGPKVERSIDVTLLMPNPYLGSLTQVLARKKYLRGVENSRNSRGICVSATIHSKMDDITKGEPDWHNITVVS